MNQRIILGRRASWAIPWDDYISREHLELLWNGQRLVVRQLRQARNPAFDVTPHALVEGIIDDAAARLNPGGEFWAVIHTKKGARRYLQYMEQHFDTAWTETITGGYRVIVGRKAER